ncbi:hypothetical protein JTB14_034704 [Gonioctena quinquepunctata]|nr:hypothetical protein JTB14_034704 [Gonioctena quinquepunctata]
MSVDSSHHEEKDGDETSQRNEDTLDEETEPIEERRYNLRDRKTREFPDFVAYSVFSNDTDELFTVDDALSSEYSDEWTNEEIKQLVSMSKKHCLNINPTKSSLIVFASEKIGKRL